jgi:hypothetical protein
MLLVKSAITALFTKAKLVLLPVVAHCLLVSKLLVQAGALLTLRRLNAKLVGSSTKKLLRQLFCLARRFGSIERRFMIV